MYSVSSVQIDCFNIEHKVIEYLKKVVELFLSSALFEFSRFLNSMVYQSFIQFWEFPENMRLVICMIILLKTKTGIFFQNGN